MVGGGYGIKSWVSGSQLSEDLDTSWSQDASVIYKCALNPSVLVADRAWVYWSLYAHILMQINLLVPFSTNYPANSLLA